MESDHLCFLCRQVPGDGWLYLSEKFIMAETVCRPCAIKMGGDVEPEPNTRGSDKAA